MDERQLKTAWQNRQSDETIRHMAEPMAMFMKHTLAKRVRRLGAVAGAWDEVIPSELREHTAVEGYYRGTLTVIVDSAAHRFQLNSLLAGGLRKQLAERFPGPLNRIKLVPGQFYSVDIEGNRRYNF